MSETAPEAEVRPGVRVMDGNDFIIPAGAIVIRVNDDGEIVMDPVVPKVRYQAWPDWLEIAVEAMLSAKTARKSLTEAVEAGDEAAENQALMAEFRATLSAVTASAFALDAFYAAVSTFKPLSDVERATRLRNKTPRYAWVFDAIRRVTRLTNAEARNLRQRIHTVYQLRDQAVHPGYDISDFVIHPGLRQAVPAVYAHFRTENAEGAVMVAAEAIIRVADIPQSRPPELAEYARNTSNRVHQVVDPHVTYDPASPLRAKSQADAGTPRSGSATPET